MVAVKPNNRQSEAAKELDYNRYIRENLTYSQRMNYAIQEHAPPVMMGMGALSLVVPGLLEITAGVGSLAGAAYLATRQPHQWPLCTPSYVCKASALHKKLFKLKRIPILGSVLPLKKPMDMMGDGILLLGSDMDNGAAQIWTSMDLLVRHMLLIGTTGSGKTQAILGMLAQLMAQGSGGIFCDGKADITTWFMLYTLARHYGLERQLLVINYLTSGGNGTKRSNTTNIFEIASADSLSEMTSSMMGGGGGGNDDMWRGRAEALFNVVIRAACEDRDFRGQTIVPDDLRRRMTLQNLLELPSNNVYSQRVRDEAQLFLNDLPGYSAWQKATQPQAKESSMGRMSEQLGFLQMQFTRVLSLLSGTYGYITGTDISEIDWIDVINQRRIVYIMLPALEKSPESLKQLGRMVVTSMRNAMLPIIGGGKLTGLKKILIDGRPIGKQIPYGLFLDEYGSYCVEGFGDVVAQIRSMGVFACFSGQDWASFKKGSEVEASRVYSNTGTKIFLKSFDPDTVKMLVETAGKKLVTVASTFSDRPSGARPDQRTQFQSVEALNAQEVDRARMEVLAKQDPGMAHIYFGGMLWTKVKMFYPDIKQSTQSQVNSFVRMRTPIGVSGIVEDAERLIAMKKKVEAIRQATSTYLPTAEAPVIALAHDFNAWAKITSEQSKERGAELFSTMQRTIKHHFGTTKPAVPGAASPQPEKTSKPPVQPVAARPSQPSEQAAKRGLEGTAGASLAMLEQGIRQLSQKEAPTNKALEASSGFAFDLNDVPEIPNIPKNSTPGQIATKDSELPVDNSLIHPADISFSMDDHAADIETQTMIARTQLTATVISEVKQLQQNGGDALWSGSPPEARAAINTAIQNTMPTEPQNAYPEAPVPKVSSAALLKNDLLALKSHLTSTAKAETEKEKQE
ncbi:type IV secretion system DNA-binding domain-containing protein [Pseudomonas luteola]